jgi:hypothetical protein
MLATLLVAVLGMPAVSKAADTTVAPTASASQTFINSGHGWSNSVDLEGLTCVLPGILCSNGTPSYQAAGGNPDGYIRSDFTAVAGVASSTSVFWTSPTFTAPSDTDSASLSVDMRSNVSALLSLVGGDVSFRARLIDQSDLSATTIVPAATVANSATFQTRTFTVAPSAFQPGHTYKLEFRSRLSALLSLLGGTGDVDYDNVALSMVDSHVPTGLTASVPGDLPTRVVGAANPDGLSTSIVVDYGTTTGYGATSGPTIVTGAGAQPYTIDFGTLLPNTLYHYRVTATNSDGSVQTTDQVFTSPAAPTTGGPGGPGDPNGPGNPSNNGNSYTGYADVLNGCFGKSRLALIDVRKAGSKVRVSGISALAPGTAVEIRDKKNKRVGKTQIKSDGSFTTTVKKTKGGAAKKIRYSAVAGQIHSRKLALIRANAITSLKSSAGVTTIKGKINARIAKKGKIQFRALGSVGGVSCDTGGKLLAVHGTVKLNKKTGSYTFKVGTPTGGGHMIIRTRARRGGNSAYSTFTIAR